MLPLPTPDQVVNAFKQTGLRPSGNLFSGWTGRGVHCGCALAAYAEAIGHPISSMDDAVKLFGEPAREFMLGWDNPDCLYDVDWDGYLYKKPVGEQGARCWWACVEAGLVPNSSEIRNSDIRCAPDWWRGVSYRGPVGVRSAAGRHQTTSL